MALTEVDKTLDRLVPAKLVDIYNAVSERKIGRFSDKLTAVKRTAAALEKAGKTVALKDSEPGWVLADEGETPAVADGRRIYLRVERSPKQPGSKSEERFLLYRSGMTVGDYVKACADKGYKRRVAIRDIGWDELHGFIRIEAA